MSLPKNLDDGAPICERTRTRMPMNHVSMDELDALLGNRDEGLFDEEGEQYQQFLRVRLAPSPYAAQNISCEAAHSRPFYRRHYL